MKNFKNGFLIIALVLILVSTVFMSIQGHAGEVELDFSYTEMQHSWRGPDNVGDFEGAMKSYGATYWKDNGFGLRLGYGTSERLESTGGRFNRLVVDIDPIISVELLYRFNISDEVYLFGGVGQYYIPSSAYSLDTDYVDGYLGDDWRPPAAVLFERQSMPGYFKPSKEPEQEVAKCLRARAGSSNREDSDNFVVGCLDTEFGFQKATHQTVVAGHILALPIADKATRYKGGGNTRNNDGAGNGLGIAKEGAPMYTLTTGEKHGVFYDTVVRRMTPLEGERLQGMPDHHTNIIWKGKPAPNGARYKAIGNSMAVVAMHWLGKRIDFVDHLIRGK